MLFGVGVLFPVAFCSRCFESLCM